jgi:tetratricopeptide (TPR) repeat protein
VPAEGIIGGGIAGCKCPPGLAFGAFFDAGEVANELARACLESNSVDQAATWYKRGYDAGLKELDLKPERRDLWEVRWEQAQAYEKQGDKAKADELYRKVLTSNAHNPTNAYARPFAKQKLGIK